MTKYKKRTPNLDAGLGSASAESGPFFFSKKLIPSGWLNPLLFYDEIERCNIPISLLMRVGAVYGAQWVTLRRQRVLEVFHHRNLHQHLERITSPREKGEN